jgi:hypothetical protein
VSELERRGCYDRNEGNGGAQPEWCGPTGLRPIRSDLALDLPGNLTCPAIGVLEPRWGPARYR